MRETIVTELESVEYGIWDAETEEFLTDAGDIEEFISKNNAKKVAQALVDSMNFMLESLKEAIGSDLVDCYRSK